MKILISFILGFVVATVGISNLLSFTDYHVNQAKEVIIKNVK
jgi:hypothetical protein